MCVPADPVAQLRAIQAAADGIAGGGAAGVDLPVDGVVVTAVKPLVSGADPVVDTPGFFVQAGNAGLFVEAEPIPPPVVGSVVSFRVTLVAKERGQRRAKAIANYSVLMTSGTMPTPISVSSVSTPQLRSDAESTLVRVTSQPVSGGFDAGTGYGEVGFGSSIAQVRMPATLNSSEDLRQGCTLSAVGPLWLTTGPRDQLHVWASSQLAGTTCVPPALVQVTNLDAGVIEVNTTRFMAADAGLGAFSIVSRSEGLLFPPLTVSLTAPQRFTLTGPWMRGFEYELSATLAGPRDTRGGAAVTLPVLPFVSGGCTGTASLAISTVFPGSTSQYVELHNRTTSPIQLNGWRVAVRTSGGSTSFGLPSGVLLGPGQYYLISNGAPAADLIEPALSLMQTGSWVAIGPGITNSCATSGIVDWVSFGSGSSICPPALLPPPRNNSAYRRFDLRGCLDTNTPSDWLDLPNPAPRRLLTPPDACLCP